GDEISGRVAALVATEPSADVRAAVYRTLTSRGSAFMDPEQLDALLPSMLAEQAPATRLEAFRVVAVHCRRHPDSERTRLFDDSMVPWLRQEAEQGESAYARQTSLGALGLADTPGSRAALLDLTHAQRSEVAAAARHALDRRAGK